MEEVSPDIMENVAKEFVQLCERGGAPLQIENREMEEELEPLDRPKRPPRKPADLSALKALAPDHLFELIRDEHPQTIAMILVHVSPEAASEILAELPDETRGEVGFRIATLDKIGSSMVDEVAKFFDEALYETDDSVNVVKGGVDLMANILNELDSFSGEVILEKIDENNSELAAAIKQKMFTFDDVVLVDNMGLQKVLRRVESQELAKALKAASSDVKEKIFSNMSERAGEMLREEIEVMGAVRMKDVEDAQNIITRAIQEMEEQGELIIAGRRGGKSSLSKIIKVRDSLDEEHCRPHCFPRLQEGEAEEDTPVEQKIKKFNPIYPKEPQVAAVEGFEALFQKEEEEVAEPHQDEPDLAEKHAEELKESFSKGFVEGEKSGSLSERQRVEPALEMLRASAEELRQCRESLIARFEEASVELALAIAEKVVCHEISINKGTVVDVLKRAVKANDGNEILKIKINPSDLQYIQETGLSLSGLNAEHATLEGDDAVQSGGCVIQTDFGYVDAMIDHQLEAIAEALRDQR